MTTISERIAREHTEFLDQTGVSEGCRCGTPPGGEMWFAAHVAEVTEAATRESIVSELLGRADALYPLAARKSAKSLTIAVHTTLLEAVHVARGTDR